MAQRSILSMFKKTNVQDTICRPGKPTDTLSKSRTADPKSDVLGLDVAQGRTLQQIYCGDQLSTTHQYIRRRCVNNGRIYAVQYSDAGYQHTYK